MIKNVLYLIICSVISFFCGCNANSHEVNHKYFSASVSYGQFETVGYAVILKSENGKLYLLSAKHIFNKTKGEYYVTFSSGKSKKIINIKNFKNNDTAIIEIDSNGLFENKDYKIPQITGVNERIKNMQLYILNDEYYNMPDRKISDTNNEKIYLNGNIEKGRSGSPVFIKNSSICLGIVSGYFTKNSAIGEKILILTPENKYWTDNIIYPSKNISVWEKIKEIINNIWKNILSLF